MWKINKIVNNCWHIFWTIICKHFFLIFLRKIHTNFVLQNSRKPVKKKDYQMRNIVKNLSNHFLPRKRKEIFRIRFERTNRWCSIINLISNFLIRTTTITNKNYKKKNSNNYYQSITNLNTNKLANVKNWKFKFIS